MILRLPLPFLVALLALVRVGGAQDLVLGETGRLERGRLVAIDDRAVVWGNASGELREMPLDACVAVSSEFPLPIQPSDPGVLVLSEFAGASKELEQVRGILAGIEGEQVLVDDPKAGRIVVDFSNIDSAKLMLTDALISATVPLSTEGADDIVTQEQED